MRTECERLRSTHIELAAENARGTKLIRTIVELTAAFLHCKIDVSDIPTFELTSNLQGGYKLLAPQRQTIDEWKADLVTACTKDPLARKALYAQIAAYQPDAE